MSQVTPGGGALKIKLSKTKPLQITAGAPERKSGTVLMKPENIQSSKQSILSSHIDTSSESTQAKRRIEVPLLITPKHLGNNIEQQKGIPIKGKNDLKDSNNHRLARERVTQGQSNESRGNQVQVERITHQEMGVEEIPLEELVGIRDFQVKEGVLPEEMVIREEGEVMMTLTLVMMGMGMISPPLQTPLSQRKENRRDPNMFMYSKDHLVQKVKKVNLDKQEEMVEMGKIFP